MQPRGRLRDRSRNQKMHRLPQDEFRHSGVWMQMRRQDFLGLPEMRKRKCSAPITTSKESRLGKWLNIK